MKVTRTMERSKAPCKPSDQASGRLQLSRSRKMSAFAAMGLQRLRDDAHVGDAGRFYGIHHSGERAKRDVFFGAHINRLVLRVAYLLPQLGADFVDIDSVVAQEYTLRFINGNDQPLLGDFLDRARLGNVDFNP